MAIVAGGQEADDFAIADQRLVMIKQWLRVCELQLDHAVGQAAFFLIQHRLLSVEIVLVQINGEAQACLQHMILIRDIMAKVAEGLFNAASYPAHAALPGGLDPEWFQRRGPPYRRLHKSPTPIRPHRSRGGRGRGPCRFQCADACRRGKPR